MPHSPPETAPEQQRFRALNGSFLPTLEALYDDQEIVEKVPVIALGEEAIKNARPRPLSSYYSDMSLKMAEQFNASLKGAKSPKGAIRTLDRELQEIVIWARPLKGSRYTVSGACGRGRLLSPSAGNETRHERGS